MKNERLEISLDVNDYILNPLPEVNIIKTSKIKQLFAFTHRGGVGKEEMPDIGVHARIPLKFRYLDSNTLLILSFIEIHQFLDNNYRLFGKQRANMPVKVFVAVLELSEKVVRNSLKLLKKEGMISEANSIDFKTKSYISNIRKKAVRYQIITFAFLNRSDLSKITKDFILKILMLDNKRIYNLGNISAIMREIDMSRNSVKKALMELAEMEFLYEVEEGVFGLNMHYMFTMLSGKNLLDDINRKVKIKDVNDELDKLRAEIFELKKEVMVLRRANSYMSNEIKRFTNRSI